jgi:hypothetical protein
VNATASICRLVRSRGFRKLAARSKCTEQFNLIEMLETTVTENAFSRVVAFLFDSHREHQLGKKALLQWSDLAGLPSALHRIAERSSIQSVAETQWTTPDGRFLDILVRLVDAKGKERGAIGIENKVWAGEQENQVGHYQGALGRRFPRIPKALAYLTPDGRWPATADPKEDRCPAVVARYDTLIELFEALVEDKSVPEDLRRLMTSLQNYIRKIIIMPEKETQAAKKLVRELYQNPSNRDAMRLIAEHLPCVKHLTESIEPAIEKRMKAKFPKTKSEWMYHPQKSENPVELKWIPSELSERTKTFWINFMLFCNRRNPEIGSAYQFVVAAWCGKNTQARRKAMSLKLRNESGTLQRNLNGDWVPLWVGEGYKLRDLGDKDTKGLEKLLLNGILETYPKLRRKVFASFPARK